MGCNESKPLNIPLRKAPTAQEDNGSIPRSVSHNSLSATAAVNNGSPKVRISLRIPIRKHSLNVDICAWNPTCDILMTASTDRKSFLWDFQTSLTSFQPMELKLDGSDAISCAAWSKDGKWLAAGTEHGSVILWNQDGSKIDSWKPHGQNTNAIAIMNNLVLSCSDIVCVLNKETSSWQRSGWNPTSSIAVEWITTNQYIVADYNGLIILNFVDNSHWHKLPEKSQTIEVNFDEPEYKYASHVGGIYRLARHPSKKQMFASCSLDCTTKIWSIESQAPLFTLAGHLGYVINILWIQNSDLLASCSFDGTIALWNISSGKIIRMIDAHSQCVSQLGITKDGVYLVSTSFDGFCRFWRIENGDLCYSMEGDGRMFCLSLNSSNSLMSIGCYGYFEVCKLIL